MNSEILLAKSDHSINLLSAMANRHGLIAGATGTGKTVTLKVLAEGFSRIGVPVFLADVKGDLASLSQPGADSIKLKERCQSLKIPVPEFSGFPVTLWDLLGKQGHPIRATISELGPLLLGRLLNLNDTQAAVLSLVFKIADDSGLLLLDLKDFQAMLQHVGDHSSEFQTSYGNISAASIGAIQRGVVALSQEGADKFFGEPALNIDDLIQTDHTGRGIINVLAADQIMQSPKVYATLLLWILSELFERLPEVGDIEKPKMVFFFDEAHLLFHDAPKVLLEKIELVVRLIRSKGIGVFFVTQNPLDIPETVAAQLGNRVQHALRAFSPKDQRTLRAAAETFRSDQSFDVEQAISELAVGEALVSMLDQNGTPEYVKRAMIVAPASRFGTISEQERQRLMSNSLVAGQYENIKDRESAYEILRGRTEQNRVSNPTNTTSKNSSWGTVFGSIFGNSGNNRRQGPVEAMITSAARSIGNQVARQLVRGVMGSLMGGKR